MHELRGAPEPALRELLHRLSPVDLVIVEGYKRERIPKLEIYRAEIGKPLLHLEDDWIVAIASDGPLPQASVPVVDLNDIEQDRRHAAGGGDAGRAPRSAALRCVDGAADRRLLRFSGPLLRSKRSSG